MARHSEENSQGEHECTRRQLADPKLPNLLQTSPMSIYLRILHFQVQDRNRELAITVQQQQQQQQLKPTEPSLTCRLCVLHTILSLQHCGTGYHDPSSSSSIRKWKPREVTQLTPNKRPWHPNSTLPDAKSELFQGNHPQRGWTRHPLSCRRDRAHAEKLLMLTQLNVYTRQKTACLLLRSSQATRLWSPFSSLDCSARL